jgi:hypothetical protein|eukprot:COSAG02_NODE_1933_length_10319_cov_22.624168_3_plen_32_part_00
MTTILYGSWYVSAQGRNVYDLCTDSHKIEGR